MRNLDILAAENGEHIRVLLCGEEQYSHSRLIYQAAARHTMQQIRCTAIRSATCRSAGAISP